MIFVIYNLVMILFSFIYMFLKRHSKLIFFIQNVLNSFIALFIFIKKFFFNIILTDLFGVHLVLDETSIYFILLNAIVFFGISLKGVEDRIFTFLLSTTLFSLNLLFLSYDLFNLYVMIELVSLLTFLLIVYGRKILQYWAALKYIILGSLGMSLYLFGTAMVYRLNHSFSVHDIKYVPIIALSLMIIGLMIRSGVFLLSIWQAHAEAETVVSAILSGVVVKTGVYALLRIAEFSNSEYVVSYFGAISAVFGASLAFLSNDYKKLLAYSTFSQVGIILSSFQTAPLYSLAHGVFKSWLFLLGDDLPTRKINEIKRLNINVWIFLILASFSISGLPGTSGYIKNLVLKNVPFVIKLLLEIAFIGTCASFVRFFFIKVGNFEKRINPHYVFFLSISTTLGVLFFNIEFVTKSILTFLIGIFVHLILYNKFKVKKFVLEDLEISLVISIILMVVISWLMLLQQ